MRFHWVVWFSSVWYGTKWFLFSLLKSWKVIRAVRHFFASFSQGIRPAYVTVNAEAGPSLAHQLRLGKLAGNTNKIRVYCTKLDCVDNTYLLNPDTLILGQTLTCPWAAQWKHKTDLSLNLKSLFTFRRAQLPLVIPDISNTSSGIHSQGRLHMKAKNTDMITFSCSCT